MLKPAPRWSLSADWWSIDVDNTMNILTLRQLVSNAALFPEKFIRDPSTNVITTIDQRWINSGARETRGVEFAFRGGFETGGTSAISYWPGWHTAAAQA